MGNVVAINSNIVISKKPQSVEHQAVSSFITKQVYGVGDSGRIDLTYEGGTLGKALNLSGYTWLDYKYNFIKSVIGKHKVIITDTDLLAHDDYIEVLLNSRRQLGHEIIFVLTSTFSIKNPSSPSISFLGSNTCGASSKRLKKAQEKLTEAGIKTKYFVDHGAAVRYIRKKLFK